LQAAKKVADFLGTDHHEFHFTPQEAIDAIPDVVYHLESYEQVQKSPVFVKRCCDDVFARETTFLYITFPLQPWLRPQIALPMI
jgi:hypothetical protein